MSEKIRINGWIRKLTTTGIVYYVKRQTGETRWDHPGLSVALESLNRHDNIRYAAYRLSSKLLDLSQCLGTTSIPLSVLVNVTSHHGVLAPSIILDSQYIRDILNDVYNGSAVKRHSSLQTNSSIFAEAMANFIEQLLDPAHQGGVTSLGLKTVMTVFCRARLKEKLLYLFREHSHKGMLGQTELTYMLSILSRIPEMLGEGIMFGSGVVGGAVHSALQVGGGRAVTQEAWLYWAGRDPPELVWLTTSYRLLSGADVVHGISCSVCQQHIVGLRYQCLQCLGYDLCQQCFFTGASSRGHRPKHPVQEYCFPSSKGDQVKAVLATIVNKFKPKAILKQRKKVTRKLTVDKLGGMQMIGQFRHSFREPGTCEAQRGGSLRRGSLQHPDHHPDGPFRAGTLPRQELGTDGPLSRQDPGRRSLRIPSRNYSPTDDFAAVRRPDQPGHPAYTDRMYLEEDAVYDRISPSSSGFCSGSDSHSSEARPSDDIRTGKSPKREKPPRKNREKSQKKLRENLNTEETGNSGESKSKEELIKSRESVAELEWDDAGTQLNSDFIPEQFWRSQGQAFDHSILRRDIDTGELLVYKDKDPASQSPDCADRDMARDTNTPDRNEIFSIIGHLESNQKRLTDKLRQSPDLAEPITEAQDQLKRLKDLMFDIFGPRQILETEVDRQLNLAPKEELEVVQKTLVSDTSKCHHQVESTRLDGVHAQTPKQLQQQRDILFSPIVFDTEQDDLRQKETPTSSFNETEGTFDLSFTRYELSDLSRRLGGTGISYSKDSLLEISEKLEVGNPGDLNGSCRDAVDELEDLMHSLSDLFQNFSTAREADQQPPDLEDIQGEPGRVLRIVAELNKLMTSTKETKI